MTSIKERIDHIMKEQEWLENRMSSIFSSYCQIYGIREAYGVDSWEIWSDKLEIIQDTTCKGCYDCDRHNLPLKYLYSDDYESLIKQDFIEEQKRKEDEKQAKKKEQIRNREEKERETYQRLKAKFEGEMND